jgi:pyruvate dehydrogenase E1 component alpha subunit
MDVLAVREAGLEAVERARKGEGPTILDVKTYRYRGHSMSDPAKYRTKEEVAKMREQHDPIDQLRKLLIDGKHASEEDLKAVDAKVKEVVVAAADFAQTSPEPDPSELYTDVLIGG